MSRIGRKAVAVPAGVTVTVADQKVVVKGPKGELSLPLLRGITVVVADDQLNVSRSGDEKQARANHGLIRSLLANTIIGVTQGFRKTLKLVGTGYRVQAKGAGLSLAVGYSHPVEVSAQQGISLKVEGQDTIYIEGIDKQQVGQVAANIRKVRPPEPYKGKGIRYEDEVVRKKQGKAAA
ncbi:50S ribosomal protein L6 [Candidatus Woesebacteria bacterium]|nr:50S ribosomal protein L6 [Candidatus Woesebacteria bacterium]